MRKAFNPEEEMSPEAEAGELIDASTSDEIRAVFEITKTWHEHWVEAHRR